MKDIKLLTYYFLLSAYLIVAFFLETNLRIMANILFCIFSALLYFSFVRSNLNSQNIYFTLCLILAALGCFMVKWRFLQMGQTFELINSIFMLACLLFSIKNRNQYLFLGKKWILSIGIFLTLLSILYFTVYFLPHIKDFNVPLAIIIVFILGFLFIITLIRMVNHVSSFQLFLGVCLLIGSYVAAAFSTYQRVFNVDNFWEDLFAIISVFFLTLGMIKNSQIGQAAIPAMRKQLSVLYFLRRIFY